MDIDNYRSNLGTALQEIFRRFLTRDPPADVLRHHLDQQEPPFDVLEVADLLPAMLREQYAALG